MEFSPTQKKAILTRNKNILVSAAAGSGKTAVLTERIVSIISSPENSIDRLLVVTFTNAAAAEMLKRTEDRIKELLGDPKTKNKNHLRKQLRLINNADITTIDSFCGKLVRKFFYKTDMDPSFAAAPESRLVSIRQEAMDAVIDRAFKAMEENDPLFAPMNALCEMFSTDNTATLELEEEIIKVYRNLSSLPYPEKWLENAKSAFEFDTYEDFFRSPLCKILKSSLRLDEALFCITESDKILSSYFGSNIPEDEKQTIRNAAEEEDPEKILKYCSELNFSVWRLRKKTDPELAQEAKALRDRAKAIVKAAIPICSLLSRQSYEIHKKALPAHRLFCCLVEDFMREYGRKKSEKNIYEFSDVERACLGLLRDENGGETETAAYLKAHYTEILTDEYQDTNPLQEEILKALSRSANRFMVGDIKQSIYAFRNADPGIFTKKYNLFKDEPESSENCLILLSENYRSKKSILDFVNLSFGGIMSKELGGVEYEELNFPKSKPESDNDPKPEICILNRNTRLDPPEISSETEQLRELCEDKTAAEALLIAKKIKAIMKEDTSLRFGDIVILLSRLEGITETLTDVLERCGIPTVTDKPADSTNFIENKTILSFLKTIDNPLSDIDLVTVLHSPIYRISAEELCKIKLSSDKNEKYFYETVKKYYSENDDETAEKLGKFFSHMKYFRDRFLTEPASSVLSEIYNETGYYSYLNLLNDSEKRRANLNLLLELAAEYDGTGESGLYGFLTYLGSIQEGREFRQAMTASPTRDSVHIMSIHGSKGLQFPVVFVSQIQRPFRKADRKQKILLDRDIGICMSCFDPEKRVFYDTAMTEAAYIKYNKEQIAENMRLYYVAMTRAESRLIITASENPGSTKAASYEELLDIMKNNLRKNSGRNGRSLAAEDIYGSRSFLSVLMSVLPSEEHPLFNMEFSNWYELEGVIENNGAKVYREDPSPTKKTRVEYPYEALVTLPTNLSVTEIKKQYAEEMFTLKYGKSGFACKKPKFLRGKKTSLTPMERGTAYHTLLSAIDYKSPPEDIDGFKRNLAARGLLTNEESDIIDPAYITAYLGSPLAKRAASALYFKKEHPFTMGLSVSEVYPDMRSLKGAEKEVILTHGVIDLFFEENDGLVIVDFKTDRDENDEYLKKCYRPQLEIYKTALEEATGKRVKELWLCLIYRKKSLLL